MSPSPEKRSPPLTGWVLKSLRDGEGWNQADLAAAAGVSEHTVYRWENGDTKLRRKKLEELAALMGYPPGAVEDMLGSMRRARRRRSDSGSSPVGPTAEDLQHVRRTVGAAMDVLEELAIRRLCSRRARRERAQAEDHWTRHLLPCKPDERRYLVEESGAFQTWAMAELLAHQSEKAAADSASDALELAQLAVSVAELATVKADERWRSRLVGYAWIFVANAWRVRDNVVAAESASAKAEALWQAGEDSAGLLAEWRLADRCASLRRDQQRFSDALRLHAEARAISPQAEVARILLNKSATLERMTDYESALSTLTEAEPLIDTRSEPRQRWGLLFNRIVVLCHLGRLTEATELLPETRALASRLGNRLDQLRLRWLEGRVAMERGDFAEAQRAFEEVRWRFEKIGLPHEFALASLDLALIRRGQGRWGELRDVAAELVRIFEQHQVHREALAAVILFKEAATKEAVTVHLVRRLKTYLEEAQRAPELRFEL